VDTLAKPETSRLPLRWILRVVATAVALGLLAWWLPADELWTTIRSIPLAAWPLAIAAYLGLHLVGVAKWRGLINAAGAGLPARPTAQAYYWGLFGNLFLPSIVGGDVVRAGVAMRTARSRSAVLFGSLVDRIQDVAGLGLLAGIGALLSPRALDAASRRVFVVFIVLLAAAALAGLLALRFFPVRLVPWKVRRKLVRVRQAVRATTARPRAVVTSFTLGMLLQTGLMALNWQLGLLVGIDAPAYVWLFVWPLAKIAGLTPLTQGGIGVREAALAALFAPFGVEAVKAVAAGLVFAAVLVTGGLVSGGLALVLRHGTQAGAPVNSVAGPA
jgi:uncharacterized protein (TIRG00374 family)